MDGEAAAAPRAPAVAGGVCSDPTLAILVGVQVFTVVTALLAVAANVWVMVQSTSSITVKDIALRVYAIIFCGVIILAESEWALFMDQFKVFENFSAKGVWYGFVGLLTLDVNGDATIDRRWQNVIACALIGWGALHFLLGVLQFRYVREARLVVLRAQSDQTRSAKSQDGGDLDWAKDSARAQGDLDWARDPTESPVHPAVLRAHA